MKVSYPTIPPGISKIKIGRFARSVAGAQAVTGVGFSPKIVIFFAFGTGGATEIWSNGFDDSIGHRAIVKTGDTEGCAESSTQSIAIQISAGNIIQGYISSMDADGFTVTWTLTGVASAVVCFLAMR